MRMSFRGILTFAIVSTVTVIVGLAIYNRLRMQFPALGKVVQAA